MCSYIAVMGYRLIYNHVFNQDGGMVNSGWVWETDYICV